MAAPLITPLLGALPVHERPDRPFFDLAVLVPQLLDLYPGWNEDDVRGFVEEKTRSRLHPEDVTGLRVIFQRCSRLRTEFNDGSSVLPAPVTFGVSSPHGSS